MATKAKIYSVHRNPDGSGRYTIQALTATGSMTKDIRAADNEIRDWYFEFVKKVMAAGKALPIRDYEPFVLVVYQNWNVVKEFIIDANDEELAGYGVDVKAR